MFRVFATHWRFCSGLVHRATEALKTKVYFNKLFETFQKCFFLVYLILFCLLSILYSHIFIFYFIFSYIYFLFYILSFFFFLFSFFSFYVLYFCCNSCFIKSFFPLVILKIDFTNSFLFFVFNLRELNFKRHYFLSMQF